jgi:hypothetical protein
MKRFAQNKKPVPDSEPSYEKEIADAQQKQLRDFIKSEEDAIKFCKHLVEAGNGLKEVASKIPQSFFLASIALSNIGDQFTKIGNDVITVINVKKGSEIALGAAGVVAPMAQGLPKKTPTGKNPGLKRFIPFYGDYVNFSYTKTLTSQKDLIDPIEKIFAPYKCDKSHDATNAPVMYGLAVNFRDHPELDDQYRAKLQSAADMAFNLGAQVQNLEALAAYIATLFGNIPAVALIRGVGGLIQIFFTALNIILSPSTYDLSAFSGEGFKGGGIDPTNPFAILNNIPGLSEYIKAYEAKPIAQEVTKASEKRIQNFILESIIKKGQFDNGKISSFDYAYIKDLLGNLKALAVGSSWKGITITGIYDDHVEYKDKDGNRYSIRPNKTSFSFGNVSKEGYINETDFLNVMEDAAKLSTSGVKGDVGKLLSKRISDIMSLVFQLKNKYPWIGDTKNSKWINLQSDIVSHVIRKPKKRKQTPWPAPSRRPGISPVNPNQTPGRYNTFWERQEELPPL